MIPKIVHYTFISETKIPESIKNQIERNKRISPGFKFIFYDDDDCDRYIKNNFDKRTYNAYNRINPVYGAMKSDFFRYCVLFVEGGVYIDIKTEIFRDLDTVIRDTDICLLDLLRDNYEPWRKNYGGTYEQWLLIFSKRHPYLFNMIRKIVEFIENNYYPIIPCMGELNSKQKILNITGPDALAKVVTNSDIMLHRCVDYGTFASRTNRAENYYDMYTLHGKKHYSEYTEPLYLY
jgi:mannosyltransferase OCH1-like enzyme